MQSDPIRGTRDSALRDLGFRFSSTSATGPSRQRKKATTALRRVAPRALQSAAQIVDTVAPSGLPAAASLAVATAAAPPAAAGTPLVGRGEERQPEASVVPVIDRRQQRQQGVASPPHNKTSAAPDAADSFAQRKSKGVTGKKVARSSGLAGGGVRAKAVAKATRKPAKTRRVVAAATSRKARASTAATAATRREATSRAPRPTDGDAAGSEEQDGEREGAPVRSALSVADAVVTEYEKLLAAIPTMARHMGKLQIDTEVMAEGLETRVRSLVDGYRELNELLEQAPARVSDAASEYARVIGFRPPSAGGIGRDDGRSLDLNMEGIHQELFALREAKLALDKVVMPATPNLQHPTTGLRTYGLSKRRSAGRVMGSSENATSTTVRGTERYQRQSSSASAVSAAERARIKGGRAGDIAAAAVAAQAAAAVRARAGRGGSWTGTRRSSERRALVEMQVDPDLPLPVPVFPGHRKVQRDEAELPQKARLDGFPSDPRPAGYDDGGNGSPAERKYANHGYFVPGIVIPRQRQSHGLPRELRAIATIPTPEKRVPASGGGADAAGKGQRRRRARSRASAKSPVRGVTSESPPRPPAIGSVLAAPQETRGGRIPAPRPAPGSAASVATAREQRRFAMEAVKELRNEMREREDRLERELNKLREMRSQRSALATVAGAVPDDSDPASRAAPLSMPVAVGEKRRASPSSRGRRSKGRPLGRPPPLKAKKPSATSAKLAEDGQHDQSDRGGDFPQATESDSIAVETADAQAQTATDGVQLFLHPQPTVRDALRNPGDSPPSITIAPSAGLNSKAQQIRRSAGGGGRYDDDASLTSSSMSEGGGVGFGPGIGERRLSPPPPVVLIEGEGRNVAWRPSDDDRLLRLDRSAAGGMDGIITGGSGGSSAEEVMQNGGEAWLVLTAAAAAAAGGGADDSAVGEDASPEHQRTIRGTTGRPEAVAVAEPGASRASEEQDDVWVELAGMLALSASESTAGSPKAEAEGGVPASVAVAPPSSARPPPMSPELLALVREVVEQQKDMGEERSALMQALRAEVDSRRLLLANQELSLRERELALERRELESGAQSAAPRLAATAATAADAEQQRDRETDDEIIAVDEAGSGQQLSASVPPVERFWPAPNDQDVQAEAETETVDSSEGGRDWATNAEKGGCTAKGEDGTSRDETDGPGNCSGPRPPHHFGSNLGRLLAAGSGWRDVPLDEVRAPGREFASSLGRALAGGPAWQQLQLREEENGQDHPLQEEEIMPERTSGPSRSSACQIADAFDAQDLLWEAWRSGEDAERTRLLSPRTSVRKRASAMESRRFLAAVAEAEAKRQFVAEGELATLSSAGEGDEDGRADGGSGLATPVARKESRDPPADQRAPMISTASILQQQQQQSRDQGGGRLHLSLATAVLSVAQRLSTIEERASARAEGAESLARQALEETRKEGKDGRERQAQVLLRLKEMEHASERRVRVVAREIAELREEGRLERLRVDQPLEDKSRRPKVPTPKSHSSRSSSNSSGGGRKFVEALSLEAVVPQPARNHQPTPARSDSRSSLSEGQLRGSFSDGEVIRLTPRGRHALEDGELPPTGPPPPPPPSPLARGVNGEHTLGGGSAGRYWNRRRDPREHLTLLMSAHPHLKGKQSSARSAHTFVADDNGDRGDRQVYSEPPPQPLSATDSYDDKGSAPRRALERGGDEDSLNGIGVLEAGDIGADRDVQDQGSPLSDSGYSLEPGEARIPVRRSWQGGDLQARAEGVRETAFGAGGGAQIGLGPSWQRQSVVSAFEDTASSAGEISSGAELGEAPATFFDEHLADLLAGGGGKGEIRSSRPLVALTVGTGSSERRRRQTEIQRAVAEAELDLYTTTVNGLEPDLPNSTTDHVIEESQAGGDGGEQKTGMTEESEAAEAVSPKEGVDARSTGLEPGEVP